MWLSHLRFPWRSAPYISLNFRELLTILYVLCLVDMPPQLFLHFHMTMPSINMTSPFLLLIRILIRSRINSELRMVSLSPSLLAKTLFHIRKDKVLGLVCVERTDSLCFPLLMHHNGESSMILKGAWFSPLENTGCSSSHQPVFHNMENVRSHSWGLIPKNVPQRSDSSCKFYASLPAGSKSRFPHTLFGNCLGEGNIERF